MKMLKPLPACTGAAILIIRSSVSFTFSADSRNCVHTYMKVSDDLM